MTMMQRSLGLLLLVWAHIFAQHGIHAFAVSPSRVIHQNYKQRSTTQIFSSTEKEKKDISTSKKRKPFKYNDACAPCDDEYVDVVYESYFDGARPGSSVDLAINNFMRQGKNLLKEAAEKTGLKEKDPYELPQGLCLKLSNEAVTETEEQRIAAGGGVDAHPISKWLYEVGCFFLDQLFDERPIQRFWFLETIARIPYFSYVTMLHFYESLGWWRGVELRRVHSAQEWNELHHLLIMESLGGNREWSDRFLGYHIAIGYYWFLVVVFLGSPRIAYQFMELLEAHAVDTYGTFVRENRDRLKKLPPPNVAKSYYVTGDLYFFDEFQVSRDPGSRRPPCDTLLDVFENICADEAEHVKTMQACQDYAAKGIQVVSPHLHYSEDDRIEASFKRKYWKEWSDKINEEGRVPDTPTELSGF